MRVLSVVTMILETGSMEFVTRTVVTTTIGGRETRHTLELDPSLLWTHPSP